MARVCAPGGRIIIVTWCHRWVGGLGGGWGGFMRVCEHQLWSPLFVGASGLLSWPGSIERQQPTGGPTVPPPPLSSPTPLVPPHPHPPPPACLPACPACLLRRVLSPGEAALKPEEQSLLDRICEAYYLPAWCSIADYEGLFKEAGITGGWGGK